MEAKVGFLICALLAGASTALAQSCPYTEPGADFCTQARVIAGNVGQHVVLVDASEATSPLDENFSCAFSVGHTVWFRVNPEVAGPVTISTCHPQTTYDTVLEVWRGGECEFLFPVDCNDDTEAPDCVNGCSAFGSVVTFDAIAGESYWFSVGSYDYNVANCPFLCLGVIVTIGEPCGGPPVNLACQLAREMPGAFGVWYARVDVTDAFKLNDEPEPECGFNVGHTVWFTVTPLETARLVFDTCHPTTTYDTVVQAWTGSCTGALVLVGCNDDTAQPECTNDCGAFRGSRLEFEVEAGQPYYFQVGSYNENAAGCDLCLGVNLTLEPVMDVDQDSPTQPVTLLGSALPNPLGTESHIEFSLAETAQVEIGIFDLAGRRVRGLLSQRMPRGSHVVVWDGTCDDGRPVANGVYWARMTTLDGYESKRCLIVIR